VGEELYLQGSYFAFETSSSLFSLDGACTLSLLIKTEGLVTPLATISSFTTIRTTIKTPFLRNQ